MMAEWFGQDTVLEAARTRPGLTGGVATSMIAVVFLAFVACWSRYCGAPKNRVRSQMSFYRVKKVTSSISTEFHSQYKGLGGCRCKAKIRMAESRIQYVSAMTTDPNRRNFVIHHRLSPQSRKAAHRSEQSRDKIRMECGEKSSFEYGIDCCTGRISIFNPSRCNSMSRLKTDAAIQNIKQGCS